MRCPRSAPATAQGISSPRVNAHVIPGACAQVIPQVVGPGDVLPCGLLLVVGDTPGSLVGAVVGAKNYARAGQAACLYSCRMPLSRSRRWTSRWVSWSGSVIGSGSG